MDKCDVMGGILSFGINALAEEAGLAPVPLGGGAAMELSPGFLAKHEISRLCKNHKDYGSHLLALDLSGLQSFTQAYLMDRMRDLASQQMDAPLGIAGKRFETPRVPLGFIHLPAEGSVVIWRDPTKEGIGQVNAVMIKLSFTLGK